jgi:hypothetical protein
MISTAKAEQLVESFELNHIFEMDELLKAIVLIEQTCKEISEKYTSFIIR